jgi:hypothetical protein
VATAVSYTTAQQTSTVPAATPSPSSTGVGYDKTVPSQRKHHHHRQNAAGM